MSNGSERSAILQNSFRPIKQLILASIRNYQLQTVYTHLMNSETSQLYGVDIADFHLITLDSEAFKSIDFNLYPPERTHFLIHAIQFQHNIPSEKTMLKFQKRNQKKNEQEDAIIRRPIGNLRVAAAPKYHDRPRTQWVVPSKFGPQPILGRRNRARNNRINLPRCAAVSNCLPKPNFDFGRYSFNRIQQKPLLNALTQLNMPQVMPGMLPHYPIFNSGQPIPMIGQPIPMIGQPIPMIGQPIPMIGQAIPMMSQPLSQQISPYSKNSKIPLISSTSKQKKPKLAPKTANKAFKVRSPELIVIKAARHECQQNLQKWRQQYKVGRQDYATTLETSVPLLFQKKKANQKQRRLQKHQLIKQNIKALIQIYGDAVFNRGWPITRKEIIESLGLLNGQQGLLEEKGNDEQIGLKDEETADSEAKNVLSQEDFPEIEKR